MQTNEEKTTAYMFNLKWPLPDGVMASFTAQGDSLANIMADAQTMYTNLAPKAAARTEERRNDPNLCPDHGKANAGKHGLYCPTKVENGWCKWTNKPTAA